MGGAAERLREAVEHLRDITDAAERVREATTFIDDLSETSADASGIRAEALAEMAASGLNQTQISRKTGMTRARISQIMKTSPPPARFLLAPDAGPVTICVIEKRESERGRPAIARTTMTAVSKLTDLAASYGLAADLDAIPVPGMVDLNRPNLLVLIGPRSSALVAQAISADPVIKWQPDRYGDWYFTDTTAGKEYHSDFDTSFSGGSARTCYAHIGRIRRPDGRGSWLALAGEHAPGVAGAVEFLVRDITDLWDQGRRNLWSAVVSVTVGDGDGPDDVELVSPVYVHGRR